MTITPRRALWRRHRGLAAAAALLVVSSVTASCGMGSAIDRATAVIDEAIMDINRSASEWQVIVQRVAGRLPAELQSTIRNEAQNLADRSIQEAGIQFGCQAEWLGNRATANLRRLRDWITSGTEPTVTPPAACMVSTGIDLNLPPARWSDVQINGFDFDHLDGSSQPIVFAMLTADGRSLPVPENAVSRNTHYQLNLSLRDLASTFITQNVRKIQSAWNGGTAGLPEVGLQAWTRDREQIISTTGFTVIQPPRAGGDADFDTDTSNWLAVQATVSTQVVDNRLVGHVYLKAAEHDPDYTTVEGFRDEVLCTAPAGYRLVSAAPSQPSQVDERVGRQGPQSWDLAPNQVATKIEVSGDTDGDEAGVLFRATVWWASIKVIVEPLEPSWMSGQVGDLRCQ